MFRAMGMIDVRRFTVATYFGDSGDLEVEDIWLADEDTWDIDLAEVVKVNALAVPADRKLTYRVMQHELRLLLSFLVEEPRSPLTLRHADFQASSGHVKRFISESFGLGMLTAAAECPFPLLARSWLSAEVLPGLRPDERRPSKACECAECERSNGAGPGSRACHRLRAIDSPWSACWTWSVAVY